MRTNGTARMSGQAESSLKVRPARLAQPQAEAAVREARSRIAAPDESPRRTSILTAFRASPMKGMPPRSCGAGALPFFPLADVVRWTSVDPTDAAQGDRPTLRSPTGAAQRECRDCPESAIGIRRRRGTTASLTPWARSPGAEVVELQHTRDRAIVPREILFGGTLEEFVGA